jgi:hypothetical protein
LVWQRSTDRTHPICTNSNCGKATAAGYSQDIEEAVVIKQTKKTQPSKETAKRLNQNPKKIRNLQKHSDALSSILNGPKSNGKAKGEGNDNIAGDKGSLNGDPMNSYYGSGMGQEMAADGD